jgi:hypothetical protein
VLFRSNDPYIAERVVKASEWFREKLTQVFDGLVYHMTFSTDNKETEKAIDQAMDTLKHELAVKYAGIESCENGFSPARYLRHISRAEVDHVAFPHSKKPETPEFIESDIQNPELFKTLKDWRTKKALEKNVASFQILHQRVLIQIAVHLPDTMKALAEIKGFGKKSIDAYGNDILAIVNDYRKTHGITSVVLPVPSTAAGTKPEKTNTAPADTKKISLDLFKNGLSPENIASERGLAESTIVGHLAHFVESGDLNINALLSTEKQKAVSEAISRASGNSLKEIKTDLGDEYSYGDIHLMLAHHTYLEHDQNN